MKGTEGLLNDRPSYAGKHFINIIILLFIFSFYGKKRYEKENNISNHLFKTICVYVHLNDNAFCVTSHEYSYVIECYIKINFFLILVPNSPPNVLVSPVQHQSNTFMRRVSLAALTLQNALSILLLRYVRTTAGERFINSTAVINSEIQKTIFSIALVINEERNVLKAFKLIYDQIIRQPYDTFKTGIPALLYTLQNNLLFVAISNLDAATFQVIHNSFCL
jgi:hypothetical protein